MFIVIKSYEPFHSAAEVVFSSEEREKCEEFAKQEKKGFWLQVYKGNYEVGTKFTLQANFTQKSNVN